MSMISMNLSIRVQDFKYEAELNSPKPYLNQIKYLDKVQNKDSKSFNFKDAPNNRELVMDVFDHVCNILHAVQSPVEDDENNNHHRYDDNIIDNICIEKLLKPSKIKSVKNKRHSIKSRAYHNKAGFKFGTLSNYGATNSFNKHSKSYAQSIVSQFTPIDP